MELNIKRAELFFNLAAGIAVQRVWSMLYYSASLPSVFASQMNPATSFDCKMGMEAIRFSL